MQALYVLPSKRTWSWKIGHSLKLCSSFLDLLSHKTSFVADQDMEQKICVTSEDWFVSRFTPVGLW